MCPKRRRRIAARGSMCWACCGQGLPCVSDMQLEPSPQLQAHMLFPQNSSPRKRLLCWFQSSALMMSSIQAKHTNTRTHSHLSFRPERGQVGKGFQTKAGKGASGAPQSLLLLCLGLCTLPRSPAAPGRSCRPGRYCLNPSLLVLRG